MLVSTLYLLISVVGRANAAPALSFSSSLAASRETMEEAAYHIKEMVHRQVTGTMASIFPQASDNAAHPFALMEYHAPCFSSPYLTMLLMPISLSTRNILSLKSHPATYTISDPIDYVESPMSRSRVAFIGNVTILAFSSIPKDELDQLEKCYTRYHPDAKSWLPYQPRHPFNSFWAKFEPSDIYYVGGFGDTHYIGHIPVDVYARAGEGVDISGASTENVAGQFVLQSR